MDENRYHPERRPARPYGVEGAGGIGDAGNDAETCAFGAQPLGQLRHLGSDVGGERAATMYGLLETAKRAA